MKRNRPYLVWAILALALLPFQLAAQAVPGAAAPAPAGSESYTIRSVDFDVTGRTLSFILRQKVDPNGDMVGKTFASKEELDAYVADRRQVLVNQRVLQSVEASYELAPAAVGCNDVALRFKVVDSWNIIALPQPKYDSNSGLTIYIKGRDYDFLGSMQTLQLNVSYAADPSGNTSFEGEMNFAVPFQFMGADWSVGIYNDTERFMDGTVRNVSSLSLTLNIPGLGFPAALTATQGFNYNADEPVAVEVDPWFLSDSLTLSATIPTPVKLPVLGVVYYVPSVGLSSNWRPGVSLLYYNREGLITSVSNGLTTGRADWTGNQRRGASISVSNTTAYNALIENLTSDLYVSMDGFAEIDRRIGVAARFYVLDRFKYGSLDDAFSDMGSRLRGVIDARIVTLQGAFLNVGIPTKLFDFPAHVLIGKKWFDFEFQAQPFLDAAVVKPLSGGSFDKDWLWYSGGLEFLVYPVVMRNFIVRASVGLDLKNVKNNLENGWKITHGTPDGYSTYEIFIGIGLMY